MRIVPERIPWSGRSVAATCCAVAAVLLATTFWLPLWRMKLEAPQYPAGLEMIAYGDRVAGDLREINIINHYVGMEPIAEQPAPEMALFPYAVYALIALFLVAWTHPVLMALANWSAGLLPWVILADLQWWLYTFGHSLDPSAPLRFIEPFTPLALGVSSIGNFRTTAWVSWGFLALLGAPLAIKIGRVLYRRAGGSAPSGPGATATVVAAIVACMTVAPPGDVAARTAPADVTTSGSTPARGPRPEADRLGSRTGGSGLQERIDAARPGDVVTIDGGVHAGPIAVAGPLTLIGVADATIVGGGTGSVVTVTGHGVVIEGLTIRDSGRQISQEPAGIKAEGDGHRFARNRVENVYFGIHLSNGEGNEVAGNTIIPGSEGGVRPGHAISLWYQRGSRVVGNVTRDSRDGIYMSFADDILVSGNDVRGARYGVHSMYSERSTFVDNRLQGNLVGTALMYSEGLVMRCNVIDRHREGATAYGVLLKDIDDLVIERNSFTANRVGIYADNTPLGRDRKAVVVDNLIAGNEAALALQSTARLTFVGNTVVDNLEAVRTEGRGVSPETVWSADGRGNFWDEYRGYDRDGDGIGDLAYRYETVMNEIVRRAPLARAFLHTPAHLALENAARLFPLYRPAALVLDEHPLMSPTAVQCDEGAA